MSESRVVPVTLDGATSLVVRVYKPTTGYLVPTFVFNHGSTGGGRDPNLFSQTIDYPAVGRFFAERGWAVIMPARRGRGGSEGLYDEGFGEDRSRGYTCDPSWSLAGADRALRDIEAAMNAVVAMPFWIVTASSLEGSPAEVS
jgi:hypothetical protein